VAVVAADFTHFGALLEKAGTLDSGKRFGAGGIMAESAFALVSTGEIAGAAPAGVEPHTVAALAVRVKSLLVAGGTGFHINPCLTLEHLFVVSSMALLAADISFGMSAPLPLPHSRRGLFTMTGDALLSWQLCRADGE
jgi:hypothetical protein